MHKPSKSNTMAPEGYDYIDLGYDPYSFTEIYYNSLFSSFNLCSKIYRAFIDAYSSSFVLPEKEIVESENPNTLMNFNWDGNFDKQLEFYKKYEKIILAKIRNTFDTKFRDKDFVNALSQCVDLNCKLAKMTGMGFLYQQFSYANSLLNNRYFEIFRDIIYRTPSHKIHSEDNYSLFHYYTPQQDWTRQKSKGQSTLKLNTLSQKLDGIDQNTNNSTPLLIIYAFINRNYILDLLPDSSVVRNFQNQGFDVYTTDWGTPSPYDKNLTLGNYVNGYLLDAVNHIIDHSNSDKVSLLGYCWGGDLSLMLAALHPEKIENIVTFATPGDFRIDNNLLSIWTRNMNANSLVDTFGNAPEVFINSSFLLRSPVDVLHKYPHFFLEGGKPKDMDSILQFFATETWLYDSPPIPGEIYRQFVEDCYKKNLLINNEMVIGDRNKIDLKTIKHPFLNVIAKRDDLVDPKSSKAINDTVGSKDKSILEFDSGHVGACISSRAHEQLWPKVGQWLKKRKN